MQKDYRHCLDKLVGAVPERKAALIRSILPGIEAALNSGQSLKKIWDVLESKRWTVWRRERPSTTLRSSSS